MSPRSYQVFAGTRPEIVKLAPVVHGLRARGGRVTVVVTGQQYDPALVDRTLAECSLTADVTWDLGRAAPAERSGRLYTEALKHFGALTGAQVAIVQGDTSTVPLVAHAARTHQVPVVHVEAGLRSRNEQSLEESNRKIAAALASVHFAPTPLAAEHLLAEGVDPRRVFVVGNTACDALRESGVAPVPLERRRGAVVTAHRATNVDDPERLAQIVGIVQDLAQRTGAVLLPLHPRTEARLREADRLADVRRIPGVTVTPPLPYRDMLRALAGATIAVTDSGGLQEEAAWFGVPVVVMRRSTPRWEGVDAGAAALCGVDRAAVARAATKLLQPDRLRRIAALPCPYGDGYSGSRIARIVAGSRTEALLTLREPDLTDRTHLVCA